MNRIIISVILPVYNEETYIQEAIDSILNQTFVGWELIIVDDASNDSTSEKILSYVDPRIIYIRNEYNIGNYPARNIGIQIARGKYIAVMDADDIAYPERLQKEYEYLERYSDVLAVGCDCTINGRYIKYKRPTNNEDVLVALLNNNCFIHSSLLVRRDVILKLGGYNTQFVYAADYDLICHIALLGKIENLPEVLMMYRWHERQISQKYGIQQQLYANEIRSNYQLEFIGKYAILEILKVDHYTVSQAKMGEIICLYTYSAYTGSSNYRKRADDFLDVILNKMDVYRFRKFGVDLSGFCCGIIYLLRNHLVEGNEDDILEDIDQQLVLFCSNLDFIHWDRQYLEGWLHYLHLRTQYDMGEESIRLSNMNVLKRITVSVNHFMTL